MRSTPPTGQLAAPSPSGDKPYTATDALNDARELLREPSREARRRILLTLNLIYGGVMLLSAVAQLLATGHLAYPARDNLLYPVIIAINLASVVYNLAVLTGRLRATARADSATRWITVLVLQGAALAIVHANPNTATSFLADHVFAFVLIFATGVLLGRRAAIAWFVTLLLSVAIGVRNRGADFQYYLMTSKEVAALGPQGLEARLPAALGENLVPLPITLFAFVLFLFALMSILMTHFEVGMLDRVLEAVPSAIGKIQLAADQESTREQEKTRLEAELELAHRVQSALVPPRAPIPGYDIASLYRPAMDVGGDYYDLISTRRATWVLIGDVSGHGVSAGLIMMMAQTAVRSAVHALGQGDEEASPKAVLGVVNAVLRQNVERIGKGQYMTATALRLDGDTVHHAGLHQDILVYRKQTGTVDRIETGGVWMGIVDDALPLLDQETLILRPGDVMLLYTDGITEAKVGTAMLGLDALSRSFAAHAARHDDAGAIVNAVLAELGSVAFADDVTMVAVRRTGDG